MRKYQTTNNKSQKLDSKVTNKYQIQISIIFYL
jgi:hypothetical protein